MTASLRKPIAVVGVSALFPGSLDATGFWRDILAGKDLITDVPSSHWLVEDYYHPELRTQDKTYAKRGAFLDKVAFDPMTFGVPPNIVEATDTSQLLALIVAQKVLEDASQGQFAEMDKDRISVILGVTSAQELLGGMVSRLQFPIWRKALREAGLPESKVEEAISRMSDHYVPWQESTFPGVLGNVVAGRIANRFDLGGTNCVTDAACASAFSAVSMGVNELYLGQSDLVITGGVDTMNDIFMFMCFSQTTALSMSGDCRPFSDQADGTMLGEGLGMVALKRLEDAERDGDQIYAVLHGVGSSSDGRAKSVYAPVPEGQAKALRRAYEVAGYSASTVELVEAHGTGTKAGDAAEFQGLKMAFDETGRESRQWCALGSVKSQIGHTKSTAGAAGLFKVVMALRHGVLPPTIKINQPNPGLSLDESPFYLNTRTRPWVRGKAHPRRASVSSFGFGGSNFHVALEEYKGDAKLAPRFHTAEVDLVVLDAATPEALVEKLRAVEVEGDGFWRWFSRHTQETVGDGPARVALVVRGNEDLAERLERAADAIAKAPKASFRNPAGIHYGCGEETGGVAFLFPGQGSQYTDMGAGVAVAWPEARAVWDAAADLDFDDETRLHDVVFPISVWSDEDRAAQKARLVQTEWAQPAIGAASLALLRMMRKVGVKPDAVGGHSFGEVTALCAAGAWSEDVALRVARKRGELMRDAAATPGAMTAVSATIDKVRPVVDAADGGVVVANHNSPTQVVLSGPTAAIEAIEVALADAGMSARRLSVATAFHSSVVAGSCEPFAAFLSDVSVYMPVVPVYANSKAAPYAEEPDAVRSTLSGQIAEPVRFVEQIEAMAASGIGTFIEVGPGAVLTGLTRKILEGRDCEAVNLDRKGGEGVSALLDGLARLWARGVSMDLSVLWDGVRRTQDPKTVVAPRMSMDISGANYGKPYPPAEGAAGLPAPNPEREPEVVVKEVIKEVVKEVRVPVPVAAQSGDVPRNGTPRAAAVPAVQPRPQPQFHAPQLQAPAPLPNNERLAWVHAYQEAQRQTAEAHQAWQATMTQAHMAFLQASETSFVGLSAMVTGQPAQLQPSSPAAYVPQPVAALPAPAPVAYAAPIPQAAPAPVYAAPVAPMPPSPAPVQARPAPMPVAPRPVAPAPVAPTPVPVAPVAAPVAAAPAAPSVDLHGLLLEVVAEKTGYPADMLDMSMNLEADLGIDSIKRVEILSSMTEKAPHLPEVDTGEMAALQTLGQIVEHMEAAIGAAGGAVAAAPAPVAAAPVAAPVAAAPAAPSVDLHSLLLEVVAEKTGYPADMLDMSMNLEADLGIDSIKRVEILSSMTEKAPHLPEVDTGEMAALQTLGQIVEHMEAAIGGASAPAAAAPQPAAAAPAPAAPQASAAPSVDLHSLLLEVVAEKTGYPADMLDMSMNLEADLGIDSIKRVEILSSMTEKAPHLPEVDTGEMAALQTLGQIVEHMEAALGGAPAALATEEPQPARPVIIPDNLGRFALEVVEAPATGLGMAGLGNTTRVGIVGGGPIGDALAVTLSARGFETARGASTDIQALIVLTGLSTDTTIDAALGSQRTAFDAAKIVAEQFTSEGGVFVTVQDTGGDFGLSGSARAWFGGLAALTKTAAQEWPKASVKAIDIDTRNRDAQSAAEAIVHEIMAGGPEIEVGLQSDGRRVTLQSVRTPIGDAPGAELPDRPVFVATGGARGVTAATMIALAQATGARLALLGRTALSEEPPAVQTAQDDAALKRALLDMARAEGRKITPAELGKLAWHIQSNREIRATLDAIKAVGGDARYISVDVRDTEALSGAFASVRRDWGPISGLVHGAGVLADKTIADKTPEQFEKVFDTKIQGLRALLAATSDDPLKAIVLFSSVAARTGNNGQCDYAMANETLNKVAALESRLRGPSCVIKSLGWGPWEGGMVSPALKARFEALGVPLIPLEVGAKMLVDEILHGKDGQMELVLGGEPRQKALLDAGGAVGKRFDLVVGEGTHPYLADHTIQDMPVVPVVMVLEWFTQAAKATRPDLQIVACRDLKVLSGIQLKRYRTEGDRFQIHCKQITNGQGAVLALELRSASGTLHYTAQADMADDRPNGEAKPGSPADMTAYDGPLYGTTTLFHGPDFQVIRSLEGVSKEGIAGELSGVSAQGWGGTWRTDVPALDGGLQLAVLWTRHALGGDSLPLRIGAFRTYGDPVAEGPMRCVVRGRVVGRSKGVCDVQFTDAQGQLLAEMNGVETILRPS